VRDFIELLIHGWGFLSKGAPEPTLGYALTLYSV
jgi:hypothetical protein